MTQNNCQSIKRTEIIGEVICAHQKIFALKQKKRISEEQRVNNTLKTSFKEIKSE